MPFRGTRTGTDCGACVSSGSVTVRSSDSRGPRIAARGAHDSRGGRRRPNRAGRAVSGSFLRIGKFQVGRESEGAQLSLSPFASVKMRAGAKVETGALELSRAGREARTPGREHGKLIAKPRT